MVHPYQPKDKTPLYDKGAGGTSPPHKDFKKNVAPNAKGIPSSVLKQRWHSGPNEFSLHNQQRVQKKALSILPPPKPTPHKPVQSYKQQTTFPKQPSVTKQTWGRRDSSVPKQNTRSVSQEPTQKTVQQQASKNPSFTPPPSKSTFPKQPSVTKQAWGRRDSSVPKQNTRSVSQEPTQKTVQQQASKNPSFTPPPSKPTFPEQTHHTPSQHKPWMAKLFSSKKNKPTTPPQKNSIVRPSLKQHISKATPQEQQKPPYKQPITPSLRTLQADVRSAIDTKGDLQLKKVAIQEMEKKNIERKALRRQSKELFKKSLHIREKTNAFKRQQDLGALSSVQALNKKKGVAPQPTQGPEEEKMFQKLVSQALDTMEYDAQQKDKSGSHVSHKKPTITSNLTASLPWQSRDKKIQTSEQQSPEETKIQQESVEKENLRKAWHDFQLEKARFDEKGLRVQNVRELHGDSKPIRRRGSLHTLTVLAIILLTIASIVVIITSLLSKPKQVVVSPGDVYRIADIFSSKKVQEVNLTDGVQEWHSLLKKQHKLGILTSFVPYTKADDGTRQALPAQELFSTFRLRAPTQLVQSLGDYYRIAQYRTDTNTTAYVMLFLVDNYPAALVGMLAWERLLVNDAAKLFGDAVKKRQTPTSNSLSDLRIIDNKDVRILKNSSTSPVSYYFFNDKALVILTGNTDLIPFINTRIRQQAALATN